MCIRDRSCEIIQPNTIIEEEGQRLQLVHEPDEALGGEFYLCLLYTSDAADERSSVDLGGRRIIKKKKKYMNRQTDTRHQNINKQTLVVYTNKNRRIREA